jgi:hypothetical protein
MKRENLINKVLQKISSTCNIFDDYCLHLSASENKKVLQEMDESTVTSAEYRGREVRLNKPMVGDVKKYKVYVKNDKGNVVKVNFGDPNMEIRRDNPKARKNFRARHNCDSPGPKWKARYWSCRFWDTPTIKELLSK